MIKKFLTFFAILMAVFSMSLALPDTPVSAASCPKNYKCYNYKVNGKKYYIAVKYTKSSNKCSYKYDSKYNKLPSSKKKKIENKKAFKNAKAKATKYCKNQKSKNKSSKEKATVNTKDVTGFTNDGSDCDSLLGMVPWYCGVDIHDEATLKSGIWTIVANILTDLTVIAAYLVIGYVIYGGYQYMLSNGDPGKVANGKKTLVQAFIGLAIVMLSNVILNTIRIALGANFSADCTKAEDGCLNSAIDVKNMVTNVIQWVIGVAGVVSAIFVVIGGISYTTSGGDPSKLQKAKQTILYALIGLTIVALAEIITAFVSNMIRTAGQEAFNNTTTIAKEVHEIQTN